MMGLHVSGFVPALRCILSALGIGRRPGAVYQVAALPVKTTPNGKPKVLLVSTRRDANKLIIPRGWPIMGKADFQAARIEAEEEAGVVGPISLEPVGSYIYRSARKAGGAPIRVDVYRLDVVRRTPRFKERGARRLVWLDAAQAASRVSEPGLIPILEALAWESQRD